MFRMLLWGCRFVPFLHAVWVDKSIYKHPPYSIVRWSLLARCSNIRHNITQGNAIGSISQGTWAFEKRFYGLACPPWAPYHPNLIKTSRVGAFIHYVQFHPGPRSLGACSCIIQHTVRCGLDWMVFALWERGRKCNRTLLNHIIPT